MLPNNFFTPTCPASICTNALVTIPRTIKAMPTYFQSAPAGGCAASTDGKRNYQDNDPKKIRIIGGKI
jgi:hypothetical protein